MNVRPARPYSDPYLAGVGLGLVLLASFVLAGRGLGASGAFASVAAGLAGSQSNGYFAKYLSNEGPWRDWLVFEIGGVMIGGFLSAWSAGRWKKEIVRGAQAAASTRIATALGGGALMGTGAVLARGCTSGLALTGGALLAAGSWLFMFAAFAAGYALAPLVKRAWR
jgi:hypothetical protein